MPKAKTEKHSKKAQKKGQNKEQKKVLVKRPPKERKPQPPEKKPRKIGKLDQVIELISRPEGATMDEIVALTGWQKHTARAAISFSIKKKKEMPVVTEKSEDGKLVYKIKA